MRRTESLWNNLSRPKQRSESTYIHGISGKRFWLIRSYKLPQGLTGRLQGHTNGLQGHTNRPQGHTNNLQGITKNQADADNPNVFNASRKTSQNPRASAQIRGKVLLSKISRLELSSPQDVLVRHNQASNWHKQLSNWHPRHFNRHKMAFKRHKNQAGTANPNVFNACVSFGQLLIAICYLLIFDQWLQWKSVVKIPALANCQLLLFPHLPPNVAP